MKPEPFLVVLDRCFMITPGVKHFVFHIVSRSDFVFLPGQFVTIHFEHEDKILRRSYSIANPPTLPGIIEFAAGFVDQGFGSELLFNLKPGDKLQMTGAFGRLILRETDPKRYIFLGTSTGITPYRAMLPALSLRMQHNPALKVVILQGIQVREDALYLDEFLQWTAAHQNAHFIACFSREQSVLHAYERLGYVQTQFEHLALNPAEDIVYLCGKPAMIDDAFERLQNLQFETQRIIREKYISP